MITVPIRRLPLGKTLSLEVGVIHFIGIGGIGMSGIAEILHNLGYKVQGSDMSSNANVERLRGMGIDVFIGHTGDNIGNAAVVVKSSAVRSSNSEIIEARARRIPVVRRAEMLAELVRLKMTVAVAGTHGKTTTTSITAALFDAAGLQPTVINGGIINAYGTNAKIGNGEWMVVEADESDGTFIKLPATIAIITNIDPEHLDYYGSFDALREAFQQFIENLPFYGFGVICIDHPEVQALMAKTQDRRIITYGFNPQADVKAVNMRVDASGQYFDVEFRSHQQGESEVMTNMFLPMFGKHNLSNSLAALAVARELNMTEEMMRTGLASFGGVKRRFTKTGETHGITIIDDYGHHPVEIAATLACARQALSQPDARVIAVVQPHRFTRVRDLFEEFCKCFNDAEMVLVADIYTAGEDPIEGINRDALIAGMRAHGHRDVQAVESESALAAQLASIARSGDFIVCLGAGSISAWAAKLPEQIEQQLTNAKQAS